MVDFTAHCQKCLLGVHKEFLPAMALVNARYCLTEITIAAVWSPAMPVLYTTDTTVSMVGAQGLFPGGRGQHIELLVLVAFGGCTAAERMAKAERAVAAAASFMGNYERVATLVNQTRSYRILGRTESEEG